MITMVYGLQYGDEGKGSMVRHLARTRRFDAVVKTAGPNSGHSFVAQDGNRLEMHQLPTACDLNVPLIIPSGGVVDVDFLRDELDMLGSLYNVRARVYIHSMACVSRPMSQDEERFKEGIGTTGMGVGTARASKMKRMGTLAKDVVSLHPFIDDTFIEDILADVDNSILVETGQGFGLSIDYHHYPYCTSKNCTPAADIEAMGIYCNRHHRVEVIGVMKPYPTRVPGNSGPMYLETTCEALGIEEQLSNIEWHHGEFSQNPARVGEWDEGLIQDAVRSIRPDTICLAYADWWQPELREAKTGVMFSRLDPEIRRLCLEYPISMLAVEYGRVLDINYNE